MQVSRKGQVTLPKEIRERLGIREGGRLRGQIEGNRMVIAAGGGIEELLGALPKPKRVRSLEEIEHGIVDGATSLPARRRASRQ